MATAVLAAPPPPPRPVQRFTVEQYERMGELGVLTAQHRCELIRGVIVEKPLINPPHSFVVSRLGRHLITLVGTDHTVRIQQPLVLSDSVPEPDGLVAVGSDVVYAASHPRAGECLLVIEVSDTSLAEDQTDKLALYAEAKLPVYWVINIPARRVEVYTQPRGGKTPTYRTRTDYLPGQDVPVVVVGKTLGSLPVSELLP